MITLQTTFIRFHEEIKLIDNEENKVLREKRDILLDKLKDKITDEAASYTYFNQGSYAMHTGIVPTDGDFDIDVGIEFSIDKDDYPDPIEVKKWVKDALAGHTKSVEMKQPCVTVQYQRDNEPLYHVDFAIYAANNSDGKMYLARGKEFSSEENRYWEESEPHRLICLVRDRFSGEDAQQFRRTIRYLKKWKTEKFSATGHSAPTGIALTMLAYNLFSPNYMVDTFDSASRQYNDFAALKDLVSKIEREFTITLDDAGNLRHTIRVDILTPPFNDLFAKMTLIQKDDFYKEILKMTDVLNRVSKKIDESRPLTEQCTLLQDIFGDDFPILSARSIVSPSESA